MTAEEAAKIVRAKYPNADAVAKFRGVGSTRAYFVVMAEPFGRMARWLTNYHKTPEAAWRQAAKNVLDGR